MQAIETCQSYCRFIQILNFLVTYTQTIHVSIKDLRVCANNQKLEGLYYPKITIRNFCACTQKFHVSIKIWRICQRTKSNNNCAQNTSTYLKEITQIAINLGVPAHVRKKNFHVSIKICVCANNPALEDFVIRKHGRILTSYVRAENHYKEYLRMYAKSFQVSSKDLRI